VPILTHGQVLSFPYGRGTQSVEDISSEYANWIPSQEPVAGGPGKRVYYYLTHATETRKDPNLLRREEHETQEDGGWGMADEKGSPRTGSLNEKAEGGKLKALEERASWGKDEEKEEHRVSL